MTEPAPARPVSVQPGDVVRLRKPHPCGGADWTVVRIGADIGLKCTTCQHRVMLARREFERRVKVFLLHAGSDQAGASTGGPAAE